MAKEKARRALTESGNCATYGRSAQRGFITDTLPFFNFEIKGLADSFLMEIEQNVNPGMEKGQFLKIPLGNRKNMQCQIVACDQQRVVFWRGYLPIIMHDTYLYSWIRLLDSD